MTLWLSWRSVLRLSALTTAKRISHFGGLRITPHQVIEYAAWGKAKLGQEHMTRMEIFATSATMTLGTPPLLDSRRVCAQKKGESFTMVCHLTIELALGVLTFGDEISNSFPQLVCKVPTPVVGASKDRFGDMLRLRPLN